MSGLFSWLTNFVFCPKAMVPKDGDSSLSNLSHEDKMQFAKFCQFVWIQGEPIPLIYDVRNEIYTSQDVTLPMLKKFEKLGLLVLEPRGYIKKKFGKHTRLFYAGKPTKIEFPNDGNNQLDLGNVLLTEAGKALAVSCGGIRNQAFYEYIISQWFQQGLVVSSIQLDIEKKKAPHSH